MTILSADDERPEADDAGTAPVQEQPICTCYLHAYYREGHHPRCSFSSLGDGKITKAVHRFYDWVRDIPYEVRTIAGGATALVLIIVAVWALFFRTHEETMTATDFSWQRRIEVIDYQPRHDNGWSHPSDAYNIDRSWRIHHYERVISHYRTETYSCGTTQSPRTCTRSVPVYRDKPVYRWWYDYTIDRWRFKRWITTGAEAKVPVPHWADLSGEHFDSANVYGNEQLSGTRGETYKVYLTGDEDKVYERVVSLDEWNAVSKGEPLTVHITVTGIIRSVDWYG